MDCEVKEVHPSALRKNSPALFTQKGWGVNHDFYNQLTWLHFLVPILSTANIAQQRVVPLDWLIESSCLAQPLAFPWYCG